MLRLTKPQYCNSKCFHITLMHNKNVQGQRMQSQAHMHQISLFIGLVHCRFESHEKNVN